MWSEWINWWYNISMRQEGSTTASLGPSTMALSSPMFISGKLNFLPQVPCWLRNYYLCTVNYREREKKKDTYTTVLKNSLFQWHRSTLNISHRPEQRSLGLAKHHKVRQGRTIPPDVWEVCWKYLIISHNDCLIGAIITVWLVSLPLKYQNVISTVKYFHL